MFAFVIIASFLASAVAFAPASSVMSAARFSNKLSMADIVDTAMSAGKFNTLAAALTAANLIPTLKGPGPFTVFAPTDAAFAKLPPGTVEALLKDIPQLTKILTYHVVSGTVPASVVTTLNGQKVKTVSGETVAVTVNSAGVKVNDASVVTTDIFADNGVIHVIDSVLLPVVPFNPKTLPGVSGPFGYFDPLGLAPDNKRDFMKFRESELKHGRVAMFAFLGIVVGELLGNAGFSLIGADITGPAIYQYQQAEGALGAWSANVIGLTLAIEGYNIVNGWEAPGQSEGLAAPKDTYTSGDLSFDPLGLKPTSASALKEIQTKEINNGRLAMLAVAGIIAQELVTGQSIF